MKTPRDLLSAKLEAARKRHAAALQRVEAEAELIADLEAKKRQRFTRELRRHAHWPNRKSRAALTLEVVE